MTTTIDPVTCDVTRLRDALLVGALTRDDAERGAVFLLVRTGPAHDLIHQPQVRACAFRNPEGSWVLDWPRFAMVRWELKLLPGARTLVDLACALTADTPVRFLGTSIGRLDISSRRDVLTALAIALGAIEYLDQLTGDEGP